MFSLKFFPKKVFFRIKNVQLLCTRIVILHTSVVQQSNLPNSNLPFTALSLNRFNVVLIVQHPLFPSFFFYPIKEKSKFKKIFYP